MTYFRPLPSAERLKRGFHYCPEAGEFVKIEKGKGFNQVVGTKRTRRGGQRWAIFISVDSVQYPAHRLAWLYQTGEDPAPLTIDHINRDPWDNRFSNLRVACHVQQAVNRRSCIGSSSKYRGVDFHKLTGKWQARIMIRGRRISLGLFATEQDAHNAKIAYLAEHPDPSIVWCIDE